MAEESNLVNKLNESSKQIKIDDTDLTRIKDLRDTYRTQTIKIGQLNVERILMNQAVEKLNTALTNEELEYSEIQKNEQVLVKELQDKYGVGQLNLDTGTFSPLNTK